MKPTSIVLAAIASLSLAAPMAAQAQTESARLAAEKAVVLNFWSDVFDKQDISKAKDYLAPGYIQHNPTVSGGLQGFVDHFGAMWPHPKAPADVKPTHFTVVLAEGDLVQLMQMRPRPEPGDPSRTYESFWFDLFRVRDGKIVEHWDGALKPTK